MAPKDNIYKNHNFRKTLIIMEITHLDKFDWNHLFNLATESRKNAIAHTTKVGAALITENGKYYSGCNIEQIYRNKDIHAEVCAISKMVSSGVKTFLGIIIVSDRERFTPCGACMDWIFQFGGENTLVAYKNILGGDIEIYEAKELMPYYPK